MVAADGDVVVAGAARVYGSLEPAHNVYVFDATQVRKLPACKALTCLPKARLPPSSRTPTTPTQNKWVLNYNKVAQPEGYIGISGNARFGCRVALRDDILAVTACSWHEHAASMSVCVRVHACMCMVYCVCLLTCVGL